MFLNICSSVPIPQAARGWPLRKLLSTKIPKVIFEKPKKGFGIPLDLIVNKYLNEHIENANDHSEKLWGLLIFQSWYKEYNQLINT